MPKLGCIFDMDGVLFNTWNIHKTAFNKILKEEGLEFDYSSISGMSTKEAILRIFRNNKK